jgi:GxxExxY protein
VIGCAFTVLNTPGAGFAEKVYENALAIEMRAAGIAVARQCCVRVHYHDVVIGECVPDLLAEDALPGELKTVNALNDARMPRAIACINFTARNSKTGSLATDTHRFPRIFIGIPPAIAKSGRQGKPRARGAHEYL